MIEDLDRATRWKAIAALAAMLSVAPIFMVEAHAGADEPGQGFAFGQGFKVDPKAGGLSIGIAFGQSTAIHTNQVGRAVSTSTNFGVVGLTLGAQNCDGTNATWPLGNPPQGQPQPLIADSRDEGAAGGKTQKEWGQSFTKSARATTDPFAKAGTNVFGGGQSGFEMGKAVVTSSSGVVNGVREARATVELDYLNAAGGGGSLQLRGLRWDALHRSTGDKKVEGHFTIGSISGSGFGFNRVQEGLKDEEAAKALDQANTFLKHLGLKLVPGSIRKTKDAVTVDPLALVVEPYPTRDSATQTALTQQAPYPRKDGSGTDNKEVYKEARREVTNAILGFRFPGPDDPDTPENEARVNGCRAGTYISVADIVVGSVTGAGEFVLSFGGVEATTGESPKNEFNLDLGQFGTIGDLDIPGQPPLESSFLGEPDILGGPATPSFVPGVTSGSPTTRLVDPAVSSRGPGRAPFEGSRGGALAVVGLVTLGVVAVVAESDRRRMRNALRPPTDAVP